MGQLKLHQAYPSGYNWPVGRYIEQINPKAPLWVKQGPEIWAQLPKLPPGYPFSEKASDHLVWYLLNIFFSYHNSLSHHVCSKYTFLMFRFFQVLVTMPTFREGDLREPVCATPRLTSKSVIFTLLPS